MTAIRTNTGGGGGGGGVSRRAKIILCTKKWENGKFDLKEFQVTSDMITVLVKSL